MIYWDNNATTPLAEEVVAAILPYLRECYYNPSAAYASARKVKQAIDDARAQVAVLVGAYPDEIIFTSGGTEATVTALSHFQKTLVLATEHPAALRTARGATCPVMSNGQIDLQTFKELLPEFDSVSFAWANHETGVLQPVRSVCLAAAEAGVRVHVDVVQAAGKLPINLHDLPVDFASLSAHKIHGPKGIGALYVRRGVPFAPLVTGGAQEDYRRAGTENVPGIIGFGKAAQLAVQFLPRYEALARLRTRFLDAVRAAGIEIAENGAAAARLPHVFNVRVPGTSAESLFLLLEPLGLVCSTGSACTSAEPEPSHVLRAMGVSDSEARESLRFSMNRFTTEQEVDQAADIFIRAVRKVKSVQSSVTGPVMVYR